MIVTAVLFERDVPTLNGRIYTSSVVDRIMEDIQARIDEREPIMVTGKEQEDCRSILMKDVVGVLVGTEKATASVMIRLVDARSSVMIKDQLCGLGRKIGEYTIGIVPGGYGNVKGGIVQDDYRLTTVAFTLAPYSARCIVSNVDDVKEMVKV